MKYSDDHIFAQGVIDEVVEIIERLANIYRLDPPIVKTSLWRKDDPKYHGKNQARDIRSNDWPPEFRALVGSVLQKIRGFDSRIQFEFHAPEHLHLEFDDNSLSKP